MKRGTIATILTRPEENNRGKQRVRRGGASQRERKREQMGVVTEAQNVKYVTDAASGERATLERPITLETKAGRFIYRACAEEVRVNIVVQFSQGFLDPGFLAPPQMFHRAAVVCLYYHHLGRTRGGAGEGAGLVVVAG